MKYSMLNTQMISKKRIRVLEDWETPFGIVPAGFESDGASVPRPFRWALSPFGMLLEAAIFHDYCYENKIKTKSFADKSFRQIALDHGVHKYTATIAYYAVKWFGEGEY